MVTEASQGRLKETTLALRLAAFVVVAVISSEERSSHRPELVVALIVVATLLLVWAGIDLRALRGRVTKTWILVGALIGIGIASGLVSATNGGDVIVAFSIVAAIGAGNELPIAWASAVIALSILAIEISSLIFGFNSGDVGWPLALFGGLLVGRNRRDARIQSAQASALVAETERTRAQEQRAATLDERARLAREIHDLLAHSLGALGIQLEAAQALLTDARDIDRAVPLLDQARRLAASGLEETRQAINALRSDTPPLPESLASLAEGHRQQLRTIVELSVAGSVYPLSTDANLALIRVAQEALTNAAKHAPTAPIAMTLDYDVDETVLCITNDVVVHQAVADGSTTSQLQSGGGYGLAGMRERLLLQGGTLAAGPSESGWTVRARIPR
ncbi:MAG: histidine kinase [Acidimicrobiales bacterium]